MLENTIVKLLLTRLFERYHSDPFGHSKHIYYNKQLVRRVVWQ